MARFVKLLLLSAWILLLAEAVDYTGHKIALVAADYNLIQALHLDEFGPSVDGTWRVHLSPADLKLLQQRGISFKILKDLPESINEEAEQLKEARKNKVDFFETYHTYEEFKQFYREKAASFPNLVQFIPSIGLSHERREIFAVRVTADIQTPSRKPQIFIQGQIHAREWISGTTVAYIFDKLLSDYGQDETITKLLEQVEFNIVALLNVDGFAYTFEVNRLWRKNRRPPPANSTCFGIDLNRNYPVKWSEAGSSFDPCSDNYHGISAASEPEVAASAGFFKSLQNVILAVDYHSSGQLILRPYGYTEADAPDEALSKTLGDSIAAAIYSVNQQNYTSQKSIGLYPTSGSANDWFYSEDAIQPNKVRAYGFTIELRPNTGGQHDIPADQIIPTGAENYAAVKVYVQYALSNRLFFP